MNNYFAHLLLLLRPLGFLYAIAMRLRAFLYSNGTLARHKTDAAVISVGNLTMGGSGKTPMVIYLARLLKKNGFSPAIISRGYGGKADRPVNVVSDGQTLFLDSHDAGDEPRLIAESLPGIPVLTGKKRKNPSDHAVAEYSCNTLILDDGFQHMQICRDLDIVLFNAASLYKNMHVFPGGVLRESFSALKRADCFVITGCTGDHQKSIKRFKDSLRHHWPETPVFSSSYLPQFLVDREGNQYPLGSLTGPVVAFCGIAGPDRFRKTLESIHITPASFLTFKDHADYKDADIASLINHARQHSASVVVTTEKDLVKLKKTHFPIPLLALSMNISLSDDFEDFILTSIKE